MLMYKEMVLAAALAFRGLVEQGGDNRGQMVEMFLKTVGLGSGKPWCLAYLSHVGYWALSDPIAGQSLWPLPATASCWVLGEYAREKNVLMKLPQRGDIFLKFDPNVDGGRF